MLTTPNTPSSVAARPAVVHTVTGPIASDQLGTTLTHEHVIGDFKVWWDRMAPPEIADCIVGADILADLRHDPFAVLDNTDLTDERVATAELQHFRKSSGTTILDPTVPGIGRDRAALRRVSERSGVQIVSGAGFYIRPSRPGWFNHADVDYVAEKIADDVLGHSRTTGKSMRGGFIGEIGVTDGSRRLETDDAKLVRGAARAQAHTHVPLIVHLVDPLGADVLDIVEDERGCLGATVLGHMSHTQHDLEYQLRLLERGATLAYDSFGIDWYFPGSDHQGLSDHDQLRPVLQLIDAGYASQLLLSSDVFLKMQLRRYGGGGYGHVLDHVVPRLRRAGIGDDVIDQLFRATPRRLFETAAAAGAVDVTQSTRGIA